MNKKIEKNIRNDIEENLKEYPFISKYWEITVVGQQQDKSKSNENIKFGHYGTEEFASYPFYKTLSRIVNFSEIEE